MSNPFDCITQLIFVETVIEPADVILIPGASQPQLMEKAAALYHCKLAPILLPSGGATPHVKTTEWEFLRDIGLSLGVPVIDRTGITKDNWFLEEDKIKRVMTEVEKIGSYFGQHILSWTRNTD
ncbi:hypothetical protein ACFFNY_25665 [Paenibacillus hodogayensis]|uniref:DUF218 domain-containing protein n=1 Tax=Paenibacillus hodogayensis TaxID=279208 RepID=A0ABV5W3I0_9BACL